MVRDQTHNSRSVEGQTIISRYFLYPIKNFGPTVSEVAIVSVSLIATRTFWSRTIYRTCVISLTSCLARIFNCHTAAKVWFVSYRDSSTQKHRCGGVVHTSNTSARILY